MTPDQERQRTELAKSILDNPVFQDAIKQIKQELKAQGFEKEEILTVYP